MVVEGATVVVVVGGAVVEVLVDGCSSSMFDDSDVDVPGASLVVVTQPSMMSTS